MDLTFYDVKPIPKYILEKIKRKDLQLHKEQDGHTRFYAYLVKWKDELVKVTVAVKCKYSQWYCKQVAVHSVHGDNCLVKDMAFHYIAGHRVGWYEEGLYFDKKWYEGCGWGWSDNPKAFDPYAPIVNMGLFKKFPQYKYSMADGYGYVDIIQYLALYEKYPHMELIVKLGLRWYACSVQLLKLTAKDKKFCKWLAKNKEVINSKLFYVGTIIKAYKKNMPLEEVQKFEKAKKELVRDYSYSRIKDVVGKEIDRFLKYKLDKNISVSNYADYIMACRNLGLDLTLDKNKYPHDFAYWHDVRIDQYKTQKALMEEKERQKLAQEFAVVVDKYMPLQLIQGDGFVCIIAKSQDELVNEGKALHHCVGSMNYNRRMLREESLIFFVRKADDVDTPLATIEYSLEKKKVLQCYGSHNSTPNEDIMKYVNKTWLPYANKNLKRLQTAA
ncbi:MAG: PcfJ domain-containing protein [Clostridia bacterium]|nr:PcfJ domain-containing protein [Clostridia bacterium]